MALKKQCAVESAEDEPVLQQVVNFMRLAIESVVQPFVFGVFKIQNLRHELVLESQEAKH